MHKKKYTLILLFLFNTLFSQLALEVRLVDSTAHVNVINRSQDYYMLPINQNHFRPYEENCDNFIDYESEFPSFALLLNLVNSNGKKVDYTVGYKYLDDFNSDSEKINLERESFQKKIKKWGRKNNLNDYSTALINYKLINSLIFLKPNENKKFKIKLDLKNITSQDLIFYNYFLNEAETYKLFLSLCNFDSLKYMTPDQRKKYANYKFFTGKLESNIIELIEK